MNRQEAEKMFNDTFDRSKKERRCIVFITSAALADKLEEELDNWIRAAHEIKKASKS